MNQEPPLCIRCHKPVIVHQDDYQLFERMHWLCFHLEFEHDGDPDEPCGDPSCPWWHIQVFRRKLEELAIDPDEVIGQAIKERWN
ncbi:MAG: hypothetical protein M3347_05015 [Armatimonadota bacterium]|nr:hypothetical protein [Armatimonadota bacterium]